MKIIVCPDSFKGSLSACEAADCIAGELKELFPDSTIISLPLADGGEGTFEILKNKGLIAEDGSFLASEFKRLVSKDESLTPEHEICKSESKSILIESSKHIGLHLFNNEERNPLVNSSRALGESINKDVKEGYKNIFVSLGGSGTCDGGIGMLAALGFQFIDESGILLEGKGCDLVKIRQIRYCPVEGVHANLNDICFTAVCDVTNPLYGKEGAAFVFGPQKGALPHELPQLDHGLQNLAKVATREGFGTGTEFLMPGAGAAGGIGYAMAVFLKAKLIGGIDFVFEKLEFANLIKDADLIITGEGKIDRQSLMGKVLSGVLKQAVRFQIPVIAIGGQVEDEEILLSNSAIKAVWAIADESLSPEQNMQKSVAFGNLRNCVRARKSWFGF